jgi:hypothetical protein
MLVKHKLMCKSLVKLAVVALKHEVVVSLLLRDFQLNGEVVLAQHMLILLNLLAAQVVVLYGVAAVAAQVVVQVALAELVVLQVFGKQAAAVQAAVDLV